MALTAEETSALVTVAIQEVPNVISALKNMFASINTGAPAPTNEEIIAAFNAAFASSIAVDDQWLASHPA